MSLLDPWPKAAVACPTCGYELLVSIARIGAEGMPWCTHDHGTITYGANPYPTWTRMVPVDPVDDGSRGLGPVMRRRAQDVIARPDAWRFDSLLIWTNLSTHHRITEQAVDAVRREAT